MTSGEGCTKIYTMDKKTLIFTVIFAALVVVGLLLYIALGSTGGNVAVISLDGEIYEKIDLSRVEAAYDIEIKTQYGMNIVHVQPGAIGVSYADCPDKVCVNRGSITGGGIPIACVPHRLVISIEGGDIDG